jgi:hypothetical protein
VSAFAQAQPQIDSTKNSGITSDAALSALRPHLLPLGFEVEAGKKKEDKIRRPVLFGEFGHEDMAYEVDGFQAVDGIALEVEAGRGARGNAVYRDLIQGSLLVDAEFLALAVMQEYRHQTSGRQTKVKSYAEARSVLEAIYASNRLLLPFKGLLLIGY